MPQIEIGNIPREQLGIGEARAIVGRGEARDRQRGVDGVANRLRGKVGAARVTALLADIDRDADALVAVVFDRFHLAAAHGHGLSEAFAHLGFGGGRAARLRVIENARRELAQLVGGVGKAG